MLSYFLHFVLQHAGDVQGFTPSVPVHVQWQLESQSAQSIKGTSKTIRGKQRILDQIGNSQMPKHLAFWAKGTRGWECCIRMLQREWNKYSALWSEKEGTSEWTYFSGKKPFWKAKTPPSSPLLFNSSFWFNAQTHAEVLRYNRDEILTTLLYSITTLSNFIFV